MRLIDADALIELLCNINNQIIKGVIGMIQTQPTAYDIEKVVNRIREDCYNMGFDESQIEILVNDIRKGGVNHDR